LAVRCYRTCARGLQKDNTGADLLHAVPLLVPRVHPARLRFSSREAVCRGHRGYRRRDAHLRRRPERHRVAGHVRDHRAQYPARQHEIRMHRGVQNTCAIGVVSVMRPSRTRASKQMMIPSPWLWISRGFIPDLEFATVRRKCSHVHTPPHTLAFSWRCRRGRVESDDVGLPANGRLHGN
jgi:hypothetical protein